MADGENNTTQNDDPVIAQDTLPPRKKSGSFLRKIFAFAAFLMLLVTGVLIFIQTDYFNERLLNFTLEKVNEGLKEKDSKISAASLTGNLLSGITLNDVSVKVKDDTLLRMRSLKLDYDLLRLTAKEIASDEILLDHPQINLTKVKDENDSLIWNIEYLLKSEEEDEDTTTSEFDWGIKAGSVRIVNGDVRIVGEKPEGVSLRELRLPAIDTFGLRNLDIKDLNLDLSANYFPDFREVRINNISFRTNSGFNIDSLRLEANIDESEEVANVRNLRLLTGRSDMKINFIRMTEFSLKKGINYEEFDRNMTQVDLEARLFNFDDLTFFLPGLNFLDSTVSLNLFAEGDYADLNINRLNARLPNSELSFSGKVKNLDEPSKLYFDVTGKDLSIDPADTRRVIPGLPVPDYSHVGRVTIPHAYYKGQPDSFEAEIDLRSSVGNINGNGTLDLSVSVGSYKGEFEARGVNLGKFLKSRDLESDITGEFRAEGRGFDYRTMTGSLDYKIRSSRFYGQNIRNSEGRLDFNNGNVKLGVNYASTTLNAKVSGSVNISNLDNLSYNLKGTARGLDISAFTKSAEQKSNLNFDFDVNGRGLDPDNLAGRYKIDMKSSSYGSYAIPAGQLSLESVTAGMKDLALNTEFADITTKGTFRFSEVASALMSNVDNILAAFSDTLHADTVSALSVPLSSPACNNFSMNYTVRLKDQYAMQNYLDSMKIRVVGYVEGTMSDSCGMFSLTSEGYLSRLDFSDSAVVADSIPLNISILNNALLPGMNGFFADIDVSTPKIHFSGFEIDSAVARVRIENGKDSIYLTAKRDSTIDLFAIASIRDSMVADFDSLNLRIDKINIANNKDLVVKYVDTDSANGIEFRQFSITSLGQRLGVNGFYSIDDSSSLKVSGKNLKVETYSLLMGNTVIDSSNTLLGNIRNLEIDYDGYLENPRFRIIAISDVLRYGSTRIGRLDADVKYADDNAVSDITFTNINNTGDFTIKGNLPLILTFDDDAEKLEKRRKAFSDKDVNLIAHADNFQIRVFQQLLPYTRGLEGTLDGTISVLGKAEKPKLSGNMGIDSGKVQVTMTKMRYSFDADVETDNAKLIIKNSRLRAPQDPDRFISATGYVDLSGLVLNDIRLEMDGNVKAFDRDNGNTELGISGDLWVGSGSPGLLLKGRQGNFDLTGNLLLIKGNIVFNPFIQEVYKFYDDDYNYGVIIDSILSDGNVITKVLKESGDSTLVLTNQNLNPFDKILYIAYEKPPVKKVAREPGGSFIYNVYVTTADNIFLKFIVNERSQQEFFGEIKTQLFVDNKDNNQIAARGNVVLGENCYYRFFRKFDAQGKAVFNGPVTNPSLDIKASYEGVITESTGSGPGLFDDVLITLDVTGPAMNPKLDITLERNRGKETGQNAASDAISYLLFGKFQDQLTFSESSTLGVNIGTSYLSGVLSNELEKVLPFLINTELSYVDSKTGTMAENTDIRFTAAFGDAVIRFGGQLFKGISNTDFIVDYPIGKLINKKTISNNLILRLERIYDPVNVSTTSTSVLTGTRVGAQVFYRIKF